MVKLKQQQSGSGSGSTGGRSGEGFVEKLRQAARAQVGRLLLNQEQASWLHGKTVVMRNGTYSAVFSRKAYTHALSLGAKAVIKSVA